MLARIFIDRPVLACVISIVILLLGGIAAGLLPVAEYPEITPPIGPGDRLLPRGQRPGGGRHRGRADRAAGQRRREDAVHDVAEQQRRLLHPGRDVRDRHRPQHGPGAGAEPRRHRRAVAARRGPGHRRDHQEAVAGHLAGHQPVLRGQPGDRPAVLRRALPEQLRHHPAQGRHLPAGRRRRRVRHGPAGLQHARLARPRQAAVAEPHGRRRDQGPARAERAGGGRTDRPAARPQRARTSSTR